MVTDAIWLRQRNRAGSGLSKPMFATQAALAQAAEGATDVAHLAAYKIPRYGSRLNTLTVNAAGTLNALEAARRAGAQISVCVDVRLLRQESRRPLFRKPRQRFGAVAHRSVGVRRVKDVRRASVLWVSRGIWTYGHGDSRLRVVRAETASFVVGWPAIRLCRTSPGRKTLNDPRGRFADTQLHLCAGHDRGVRDDPGKSCGASRRRAVQCRVRRGDLDRRTCSNHLADGAARGKGTDRVHSVRENRGPSVRRCPPPCRTRPVCDDSGGPRITT